MSSTTDVKKYVYDINLLTISWTGAVNFYSFYLNM